MSSLAERMADFQPHTLGRVPVPAGLAAAVTGGREARRFNPAEAREPHSGRWYHGTNRVYQPGHVIDPSQPHVKNMRGSDDDSAYLAADVGTASRYADMAAGRNPILGKRPGMGGDPHVYEVEPTGPVLPDYRPGTHRTKHPVRVVREVPAAELRGAARRFDAGEARGPHTGRWVKAGGGVVTYTGHLGIDRADMPQLSGVGADGRYHRSAEMVPKFQEHLRRKGIAVTERRIAPHELKPTQTTGDMTAIRGIADELKSGGLEDTKPITVSQDGRVLDGHHNWAGRLLAAQEGGRQGLDPGMRVVQVGLPIDQLMGEARGFAPLHGIGQRGAGEFANPKHARRGVRWDEGAALPPPQRPPPR